MENLTVNEAYNRCLNEHGRVDLEYISSVTEKDIEDVIEELGDQIFQDPLLSGKNLYKGWVRAEEYLSGNIRVKLADARLATKMYPGIFERNVEALEKVMPQTISEEDIYVTLGSPWVPTEIIGDFLRMISNTRLRLIPELKR